MRPYKYNDSCDTSLYMTNGKTKITAIDPQVPSSLQRALLSAYRHAEPEQLDYGAELGAENAAYYVFARATNSAFGFVLQ